MFLILVIQYLIKMGSIASIFLENYLSKLEENDLVLIFISGGGSALAPYPVDGIKLEEKIIMNKIFWSVEQILKK